MMRHLFWGVSCSLSLWVNLHSRSTVKDAQKPNFSRIAPDMMMGLSKKIGLCNGDEWIANSALWYCSMQSADTSHLIYETRTGKSSLLSIYPGQTSRRDLEFRVSGRGYPSVGSRSTHIVSSLPEIMGSHPNQIQIVPHRDKKIRESNNSNEGFRLQIRVGREVAPGNYTFWAICDQSSSYPENGWQFTIKVGEAPGSVASVNVGPEDSDPVYGGISTLTFNVTAKRGRDGIFKGTYEVSGLPFGVTARFDHDQCISTGSNSLPGAVLTIVIPSDLKAGDYNFEVTLSNGTSKATSAGTISVDTRRDKTHS